LIGKGKLVRSLLIISWISLSVKAGAEMSEFNYENSTKPNIQQFSNHSEIS